MIHHCRQRSYPSTEPSAWVEVRVNCTWTKPVESGRFSLIETLRIKFDDDESSSGQINVDSPGDWSTGLTCLRCCLKTSGVLALRRFTGRCLNGWARVVRSSSVDDWPLEFGLPSTMETATLQTTSKSHHLRHERPAFHFLRAIFLFCVVQLLLATHCNGRQ